MPDVLTKKAVLFLSQDAVIAGTGMCVFVPKNTLVLLKGTVAVPQLAYITNQFANQTWCGVSDLESLTQELRHSKREWLVAPSLVSKVDLEHPGQGWTPQVFPQDLYPCSWFALTTVGAL